MLFATTFVLYGFFAAWFPVRLDCVAIAVCGLLWPHNPRIGTKDPLCYCGAHGAAIVNDEPAPKWCKSKCISNLIRNAPSNAANALSIPLRFPIADALNVAPSLIGKLLLSEPGFGPFGLQVNPATKSDLFQWRRFSRFGAKLVW